MHLLRFSAWLLIVVMAVGARAVAGQAYPVKPVRIILPYAPGGGTSPVVSILAEQFNRELGQNFLVDNRAGGDTIIGTTAAAKATPDGYTLLMATSTILVNHWLHPNLTYNALNDFTPISTLTRSDSVLTIHPSVPANDLKEFISYARANPGKLNASSTSTVTVLHYQRFMNTTGIRLTIVNYKGGGPAMTDLLAGNVQSFITAVQSVQSFIRAGKLKGLAIAGGKRSTVIPDVPTFAEAGLKDYDPNNWTALFAPSKTPRAIIEKMNFQVRKAQEAPEVISVLEKLGLTTYPMTVGQVDNFIRTEAERLGKLVKDSGLKAGDY